ncbi:MAG: DUF362 domain-containing protein [Candidatus Aminicenantes bacterium]|nr:MAG: DUF362 domain-containing protein [Candidatus Aminicenantes bacterium]
MSSKVVVLKTSPTTVLEDYRRLIHLAEIEKFISLDQDTLIKLNLSWTKYFPSCSSQPWQVEGVVKTLIEKGYPKGRLFPVENKTVVTDPIKGAMNNLWTPVLERYGLPFFPLTDVEWITYDFKGTLLKMNQVFPEGFVIPKMFIGKNVIHLPTVKTHGHSVTTGAIKNAFGGLLKEVRHFAHKFIHEILVDLMIMQKEIHPGIFCVMDGTVCGDGAGPRTMKPRIGNILFASGDSVAVDSVAAKIMGFDPMSIPYIRMCHERDLGTGDPQEIEVLGDDISAINLHFKTRKSLVIWGDQMLRVGFLRFLERILLRSPLVVWAPFASNVYHDGMWYPTVGHHRIKTFEKTEWGKLWLKYKRE